MNIDYRLDLAINALERAAHNNDGSIAVAEGHVEDALAILRDIKLDLHRAPDPRQTAFPLK